MQLATPQNPHPTLPTQKQAPCISVCCMSVLCLVPKSGLPLCQHPHSQTFKPKPLENNAPMDMQVATPQDQLHLVMVTVVPPIMVSGVELLVSL